MTQTPERKRQYAKERRAKKRDELKAKYAEWRAKNRERVNLRSAQRRIEKRAMCLVAAARIRARRKGIPFAIDTDEISRLQAIIDNGVCELSGVPFTLVGPRSSTSPSLDRIVPDLGYVPNNLRVVCHALNAGMGDWGDKELLRIVKAWVVAETSSRRSLKK